MSTLVFNDWIKGEEEVLTINLHNKLSRASWVPKDCILQWKVCASSVALNYHNNPRITCIHSRPATLQQSIDSPRLKGGGCILIFTPTYCHQLRVRLSERGYKCTVPFWSFSVSLSSFWPRVCHKPMRIFLKHFSMLGIDGSIPAGWWRHANHVCDLPMETGEAWSESLCLV